MTKPRSFVSNLIIKPFKSFIGKGGEDQEDDLEKLAAKEHKPFAYKTLVSATKDFHPDHKLGEGGFGPVYKGKLEDGKEIAVKKLSVSSKQGNKEFMNEARLLARVQHRNVVNLLGYCIHGNDKLLVYEYLPRQSLDKFLFNSKKREELEWKKRHDIIVGVARGLLYLHEDSHVSIIHRDIKASNILLGEKWIPKIADFGMARLFPEEQTHINTRVAGTNGYMAPEYVMHGCLSVKADVYSFGVLVLELIYGQKNSTFNADKVAKNLLEWAWKLYKKERSMDTIDAIIASDKATEQIGSCIKIGLLCVQADPKLRPTMRQVVLMLLKKSNIIAEPTVPGYPGHRYRKPRRHAGSSSSVETAESSQRHTASTTGTYSSGESSHTLDSTFNSGMSSTSTPTGPVERSHEKHSTNSAPTMRTRPSRSQGKHGSSSTSSVTDPIRSQGKHGSSSTSSVTDPIADRVAGKRPMIE